MRNPFPTCIAIVGIVCGLILGAHGMANAQVGNRGLQGNECDLTVSGVPGVSCVLSATGGITQTSRYAGMDETTCQATPGCYDAARSDPAITPVSTPVDLWGKCRYVDNISINGGNNYSIFIPFRTALEWDAFTNALDSNGLTPSISGTHCSRPAPAASWVIPQAWAYSISSGVPGYPNYLCSDASVPLPQLYARWPSQADAHVWPIQSSMSCNNGMTTANVLVTWYGVDSDLSRVSPVSWDATVEYGPYVTLTAVGDAVSGNSITVPAGTPVTLTWLGTPAYSSQGTIPNTPSDIQPLVESSIGQPPVDVVYIGDTYVQSISWSVNAGSTSPAPPGQTGLTFGEQAFNLRGMYDPIVTPVETTTYTLSAVGANGVTSQASVTVNISP
jgi:hypothetical protein